MANHVSLAKTCWARLAGLLFSAPLEPDEGLWLYPCRAIHMIGMRFPLDVAFLDRDGVVVKMLHNFAPGKLSSYYLKAFHCIELSSGQLARSNTCLGDKIIWSANNDQSTME